MKTVNGASNTVEMEGCQLLVGRYALYRDKVVVKVLKVNRNTCKVEILETSPLASNYPDRILDNVPIKGGELKLIERNGISVHTIESPP